MKIVCGSCGAKYSIADEKVQGKVFKIRCKKCSNVIVVKGDSQQAEDHQQEAAGDSSMSAAYGGTSGASEWYVVIDGDQVGPISPEEIEAYYTSGRVNAESFAWRDGLSDWQPLSDLEEFAHLTQHDMGSPEDATAVVESPFNDAGGDYDDGGGEFNEDATSVMPADDFRAQFEEQDAAASAAADDGMGYGDDGGYDAGYDDGGYDAYGDGGGGYDDQFGNEADSGAYAADGGQGGYEGFGGADAGYDDAGGYDDGGSYDSGYDDGGYDSGYDDGGSYDDGYDSGPSNDGMFASFDSGADGGDSGYDGFGGMDDGGAEESEGGVQSANDMIGQRNENSVLFSLSSLDSVGAVGGGDDASAGGGGDSGGGGGAVTEGSGLIDIQNLASAHKAMKGGGGGGGGASPMGGPAAGGDDDPFGAGTMSMPALMPMGSHKSNKGLIIGLSIGGILLVGGIAAAAVLLLNKDDKPQEPQQKVVYVEKESDDKDEKDDEKKSADEEEAAAAAKAVEEGDGAKKDGEEAEKEGEDKEEKASAKKDDDKGSRKSTTTRRKKDDDKPKRTAKKEEKKDDDLGSLIDGIGKGGSKSSGGGSKPEPKKSVPQKLSRSMVKSTVAKYNGRIHSCYTGSNRNKMAGTVFVRYTVKPSGRVSAASVTTGKFKGTDVGKCVERVVRQMKFPETQSSLTVNYPFILK
ncbi:AgmX/PglI C-terminal domain-containing protein [Persicimonas caeni]|nr:AgmX/PglI C-terminal domain-containing protein [Persicimonas caeni]